MAKTIGQIIKDLRKQKNITQEELAELISVTPQAISKWERNVGYPDITQIVPLANAFGISTDVLFGLDVEKNNEEIEKYLTEANNLGNQGKRAERIAVLREAHKKFPRNYKIMQRLADSLVCDYSRKGIKEYDEVFDLCNRIIEECTDSTIRYEAIDTLGTAYSYAGKKAEMLKLAEEMPRAYFSYENFMLYEWNADKGFEEKQSYIFYLITQLIESVGSLAGHRHDNGKMIHSNEEIIELEKLQVNLIETLFPNEDYQLLAQCGEIPCRLITIMLIRNNEIEHAWKWLEKAVNFANHMDTYDFEAPHTSLVLRGYKSGSWIMEDGKNHSQYLLEWLMNDEETAVIRSDERYEGLINRLKNVAKKP